MLGSLLKPTEVPKDGTNDGVLNGYLDCILLGAALGTIDIDILGSAHSLSLGPILGLLLGP